MLRRQGLHVSRRSVPQRWINGRLETVAWLNAAAVASVKFCVLRSIHVTVSIIGRTRAGLMWGSEWYCTTWTKKLSGRCRKDLLTFSHCHPAAIIIEQSSYEYIVLVPLRMCSTQATTGHHIATMGWSTYLRIWIWQSSKVSINSRTSTKNKYESWSRSMARAVLYYGDDRGCTNWKSWPQHELAGSLTSRTAQWQP